MNSFQPIFAFLDWWGAELRSLIPPTLRRAFGFSKNQLCIRLDGRSVDAFLDSGEGPDPVAATEVAPEDWGHLGANFAHALQGLGARAVETTLIISASQVVRRRLRLPPTPDRDLPGLLSFEIERHTPFKPEEAYFSYRRDATHGDSMDITIDVAPRRIVDPLVAALSQMGFAPTRVALGDEARHVTGLGVPVARSGSRLVTAALVLLLVAAVASPLLRLESIADDLSKDLQDARQIAGVGAKDEDAHALATRRFLDEERMRHPSPLAVLNELSALLPDGTWLVQYGQADRAVILEGQTESSADLIPLLESSKRFHAIEYDAPVTLEGRDGRERFTFSLRITDDAS
jgi:general secretion pathway protein L